MYLGTLMRGMTNSVIFDSGKQRASGVAGLFSARSHMGDGLGKGVGYVELA